MTPTQRPTFTQRVIGGDGGFSYLLASGGASPSINFDFTTGVLPGAITFTRASIGTYTNNAGTLITASNNVARFNYVAGVANLLIEASATNLFLQSNNFSNASWSKASSSVVASAQFISPDGTNNGWTVDSGGGFGGPYQLVTFTAAAYTMSAWVKQAASVSVDFQITGTDNVAPTTPALQRLSRSSVATAGAGNALISVATATASVVMGLYGAQVELGSVPTSYIPTTTTSVTRAADAAVFTVPSGVGHLTFTFDDNSTQLVTVSAGSYTIPTTLNRSNIKSIVGSA